MLPLASLAARLARLDGAELDDVVADCARQRIFDTLGAMAVGLATEEGRALGSVSEALRASDPRGSALDRCRLLVGATRATEIDDIDISSCTTVGAVVVPVALTLASARAAAARTAIDERQTLAAVIGGYEAMIRLGRAINGATLLHRGAWPTQLTAAFASAAVVAVSLRLDASRLANALGIALQQVAPLSRDALGQPAYRQFALGAAAADGWLAAHAAQAGLAPAASALESYAASVRRLVGEFELDAGALRHDLPQLPIETVDTKAFPTSRQALASVAAFRQLLPLELVEVEAVEVRVPEQYRSMVDQSAMPTTRLASMLGVQYSMALAAVGADALFDVRREALPRGAAIEAWMAKIHVRGDEDLTARFPLLWGSRVEARLESGERVVAEELQPAGSAAMPLSWVGLEEKYERIAAASGLLDATSSLGQLRARCKTIGARSDGSASAPALLAQAESLWI